MTNIKHVFFDLDHTLWDFDKNSKLTFEKILKLNKIDVDLERFIEHYIPINLKYWKLYREEKIDQAFLRYNRLKETFDTINVDISHNKIENLSKDYIANLAQFNHLLSGALEILNYLKPNYELHIITNGFEEVQNKKLKRSKLSNFFKTVTNSEMAGVKKPNPKIFDLALNLAKANPKNSIMIGDSLEADVEGALALDMAAIYFNYHKTEVSKNIVVINHLLELKNIL